MVGRVGFAPTLPSEARAFCILNYLPMERFDRLVRALRFSRRLSPQNGDIQMLYYTRWRGWMDFRHHFRRLEGRCIRNYTTAPET